MRKKIRDSIFILICVFLIMVIGYWIIGNPVVFINNYKLKSAVRSVSGETVELNDIIPFEWDIVYTFAPYESKERIEEMIGFKSADIRENQINEGMVHLLRFHVTGTEDVTELKYRR